MWLQHVHHPRSNNEADGFTLELLESPMRLILTLKGTLCVGIRRQGAWESVGIWQPGSENGLVIYVIDSKRLLRLYKLQVLFMASKHSCHYKMIIQFVGQFFTIAVATVIKYIYIGEYHMRACWCTGWKGVKCVSIKAGREVTLSAGSCMIVALQRREDPPPGVEREWTPRGRKQLGSTP